MFNIKQLSQAVIWLKEHGDMDYGELQARAAETTERFNALSSQIKELESQMNENGELQNIKANVDYLLDVPVRHEAREKSGKSRQ